MKEIIVKNQAELDNIPVDFDGRIKIDFGTPANKAIISKKYKYDVFSVGNSYVEAYGKSSVVARDNSYVVAFANSAVVARDNSFVVAWGNSYVEAYENSYVETWENSSVEAREKSSVVAWDNSDVTACANSSVVAWDKSSVEAWGNSYVETWGNSRVTARDNSAVVAQDNSFVVAWDNSAVTAGGNAQVLDAERRGNIQTSGNARVVCNPSTIQEWADYNGIEIKEGKIRLYKAVHGIDGKYVSNHDKNFIYSIGKAVKSSGFDRDPEEDCGEGIHLSTLPWAAWYGKTWDDLALLELEAEASEIVVPLFETGKVRAPGAKVIREVPLKEVGIIGKIIERRKKK